jgi:hypothetical protein
MKSTLVVITKNISHGNACIVVCHVTVHVTFSCDVVLNSECQCNIVALLK